MKLVINTIKLFPIECVTLTGYNWDAGLSYTKRELERIQEADLFLNFGTVVRGGIFGCIGKRYVVSVNDTILLT